MKAVVLAAGFGKRLRPLTDYLPKVLVPVLGVAAIDHVLKRLLSQGVRQVGVNAHYRSDQLRSYLELHYQKKSANGVKAQEAQVYLAHEEEILGTGGALYNFRNFLQGTEPFWVYNGDIICDIDLASALHFHQTRKPLATLILWNYPPINTVSLDREGNIISLFSKPSGPPEHFVLPAGSTGCENCGCSSLTFTGISILSPRILDYVPEGYSEMPAIYQSIIASCGQGAGKICGFRGMGRYWADFGTISSYLNVHRDLLIDSPSEDTLLNNPQNPQANAMHRVRPPVGCVYRSGPKIMISDSAELRGFVSIGDECMIEDGVFLEDCVVWPGTRVRAATQVQRAVLGEGFICRESDTEQPLSMKLIDLFSSFC